MHLNKSVRSITYIALISATAYVGRIAFQFIPNVQPLTSIVILSTLIFGFYFGFSVAFVSMMVSNLFLGMGIWTIAQLASYLVICLITFLLSKFLLSAPLWLQATYSGILGFVYGFVISFVNASFLGVDAFWVYYLQGVPFDTMHALGNVGFYLVLIPVLKPLFIKMKDKRDSAITYR
ncbi:MAG: ECF transporter S component [Vagococcus sp.]